ncbi:MAG: hypothetical protein AVDCRST_MAG56-4414, partial [uncultured Cytophagales bacterium]
VRPAVRGGAGFLHRRHVHQLLLRGGADGGRFGGGVRAGQRPGPVGVPGGGDHGQHPPGAVHVPVLAGTHAVLVLGHQVQPPGGPV